MCRRKSCEDHVCWTFIWESLPIPSTIPSFPSLWSETLNILNWFWATHWQVKHVFPSSRNVQFCQVVMFRVIWGNPQLAWVLLFHCLDSLQLFHWFTWHVLGRKTSLSINEWSLFMVMVVFTLYPYLFQKSVDRVSSLVFWATPENYFHGLIFLTNLESPEIKEDTWCLCMLLL